jgi:Fe-S cluster assembly iron-binding protein IscA
MTVKLEVTKEAITQVRQLLQAQKPGTAVRVYLQPGGGGGCGCGDAGCGSGAAPGPSFGLAFDRARPGDEVVPVDGFSVVCDAGSAPALDGAKIDFVQSLEATGFSVQRPGAAPAPPVGSGCGCGSGGGCC